MRPALITLLSILVIALWTGCATSEVRGVPRGITFATTPVYPDGYDIVAGGSRRLNAETLKAAWQKKAAQLANGRKYKSSPLTVHDSESIVYGYYSTIAQARVAKGSITIVK